MLLIKRLRARHIGGEGLRHATNRQLAHQKKAEIPRVDPLANR
jgi:hypothetical protein